MRIILIGYGVVGQNFTKLILQRKRELIKKYGLHPRIVSIIDKGGAVVAESELNLEAVLKTKLESGTVASYPQLGKSNIKAVDLLKSLDADVVIETTPTNIDTAQPGLLHIEQSIKGKMNVITTNKGPLAKSLPQLSDLARYNKVSLLFSGTVGGGTPVLDFGKRCLSSDKIVKIEGILNGTTNYILSAMESDGKDFDEAIGEAQKLGYAEADPTLDIDGWDTACKIVIIANWIMGRETTLNDLKVEGIRNISKNEVETAKKGGKCIKLIGRIGDEIDVKPRMISKDDPMCINGTLNAVKYVSESAGDEIIIGKGAGGMETASAIMRDLLEVKNRLAGDWLN